MNHDLYVHSEGSRKFQL